MKRNNTHLPLENRVVNKRVVMRLVFLELVMTAVERAGILNITFVNNSREALTRLLSPRCALRGFTALMR